MTTSSDSLRPISAQGATLWERLSHQGEGEPPAPEALVEILKPWAKACAQGDIERLLRRMSWEGLDPMSAAHSLAGAERLAEAEQVESTAWQALPDVIDEARVVLSRLEELGPDLRAGGKGPFPELWQPWVTVASRRLENLELDSTVFTAAAVDSLLNLFRTDVARLSESAAYRSFLDLRETREGSGSRDGALDDFLKRCLADLAGTLYASYPVLARQLDRSLGQWLNQVTELVQRFATDRPGLAEAGLISEPSVRIDAVEGGVGDRHNDGRQVLLLQLSDGHRLVYKPRSLRPEGLFEEVASWCAERGLADGPAGARCLDRGDYGWMEWVASERLETEEEAREYYRRAGSLVAVAYVLRAEDLHGENLIATRRGPIVIDGEIVMQPARASASTGEAGIDSENTVRRGSCLASAMLTQLLPGGQEDRAFGGLRWPRVRRRKIRTWQNLHTDDLEFQEGVLEEGPRGNVLHVGDERAPMESFGDELIQGFRTTYAFFEANAADFEEFLRRSFSDLPVRVLLRATGDYGQVVMLNSLARNQKSGLSGSFLHEAMVTPLTAAKERPRQWPILVDERRSLERGDIPWFAMAADSTHLVSSAGEEISGLFRSSGLDEVSARLQALGTVDLEWQLTLLERALKEPPATFFVDRLPVVSKTSAAATSEDPASWNEYRSSCLRSAVAIGEQISAGLAQAWNPQPGVGTQDALRPEADWSIATGRLGTSLFAAAMAQGIPEYRDLAHTGVAPLLDELGPEDWAAVLSRGEETSFGAHSGAGSVVWALVWLSRLLGEPRALEAAVAAASQMVEASSSPDVLSRRDAVALDLEGGAAGAVLALLAVAEETGQGRWIERAVELGDRILASQQLHGSVGASWVNRGGLMQPGLAHGAAGIARAMDALANASDQGRFHLSALGALSWERSIYDGRRKNWPATTLDQWGRRDSVYLSTVCRGAPGVGLSRLMIGSQLSDAMITAEIEVALDHAAIPELGQLDNLCCGAMGRSSVLLSAALVGHGDAEARRKQAFDLANAVLARANRAGFFRVSGDLYSCYAEDLRFHYGWTGIGYHLLRLAGAEMLPDVLAAELPSEAAERGGNG